MEPKYFPEANKILSKPPHMADDECGPLHVFTDGQICVSLWELSEEEKQEIITHGKIWLFVYSGTTQPPVALSTADTVFQTNEE
jgi:hypothetical protein